MGVPARIGLVSPIDIVIQPGSYCSWDPMLFPRKGDRPHSNEASGSDLYGDLYFVIGEETLILPSKQSLPPIQYDSVEAKALTRPVNSMVNIYTIQMLFPINFVSILLLSYFLRLG